MFLFLCLQDYGFVKIPYCEIGAPPSSVTRGRDCTSHNPDRKHLRQTGGFCCDTLWESRVGSLVCLMLRNIISTFLCVLCNDLSCFLLFFSSPNVFPYVIAFKNQA